MPFESVAAERYHSAVAATDATFESVNLLESGVCVRIQALAIAAALGLASLTAHAQGGRRGQAARGTSELQTVLYNAANALGILRGLGEEDSITTIEYWATGTMNAGGQAYRLTSYRASINYSVPGMRVDLVRTGANGQPQRQVLSVSGAYAWNDTKLGMSGTPAPEAASERLVQLWTTPIGVVKAAMAAGAGTKVTVEGGATVLTFPLPAPLASTTAKATLNGQFQTTRVETRLGNILTETTYSDYGDWNAADYKADVMTPRHIVQKQGGATVQDLTIAKTNTYNPYVVMPVPDNVESTGRK
jgi:hypothetical protein